MWYLFQFIVMTATAWAMIYALGGHPTHEESRAIGLTAIIVAVMATLALSFMLSLIKWWQRRHNVRQRSRRLLIERRRHKWSSRLGR